MTVYRADSAPLQDPEAIPGGWSQEEASADLQKALPPLRRPPATEWGVADLALAPGGSFRPEAARLPHGPVFSMLSAHQITRLRSASTLPSSIIVTVIHSARSLTMAGKSRPLCWSNCVSGNRAPGRDLRAGGSQGAGWGGGTAGLASAGGRGSGSTHFTGTF